MWSLNWKLKWPPILISIVLHLFFHLKKEFFAEMRPFVHFHGNSWFSKKSLFFIFKRLFDLIRLNSIINCLVLWNMKCVVQTHCVQISHRVHCSIVTNDLLNCGSNLILQELTVHRIYLNFVGRIEFTSISLKRQYLCVFKTSLSLWPKLLYFRTLDF